MSVGDKWAFFCIFEKNMNMPKRVFISHASEDEPIVTLFVEKILQAGSDVKISEITYTSQEDMGITNGDDIPESIKAGIKELKVKFVSMRWGLPGCVREL